MSARGSKTRLIAWDRVSFRIPRSWDLSRYRLTRRVARLELEDEYALRLEMEWLRSGRGISVEQVRRRYEKRARRLAGRCLAVTPLTELPDGWSAYQYELPDGRKLLQAFAATSRVPPFVFLQVHFGGEDRQTPRGVLATLTNSLTCHQDALVPWDVCDVHVELPPGFELTATMFQAGRKMFTFQWRLRRLYLWQFSLADMILREESAESWCADILNGAKAIRGTRFAPGPNGEILARRSPWHPLGHADEIGRWCFRYLARCAHDEKDNRLFLWAFNFRRPDDLEHLRGMFGPFALEPPRHTAPAGDE